MYVNNGKISPRQTFRLYVFDLMGIGTLLLPPYLATLCGSDGIWVIVMGGLLGAVYLTYLGWILRKMQMDLPAYLFEKRSKWVRIPVLALVGVHGILTAGFCGNVFTKLMMESLVQGVSYELILAVVIAVAVYAVSGGIEVRARIYEVLFWFVLIPYGIMMLASVRNFKTEYIGDFFVTGPTEVAEGVALVFFLLTPLFFSLFLVGNKEKHQGTDMVRTVMGAVVLTTGILIASYTLLLGNFGAASLSSMNFPVITLMSTIQFEGNFLKRMDALMVTVWFFTLYALLNLHLHYGIEMCGKLFAGWKKGRGVAVGGMVYAVALWIHGKEMGMEYFLDYYSYVAVPLMVIGPLLLILTEKKRRYLLLLGILLLTGCGGTELEERSFPMFVAVEYEGGREGMVYYGGEDLSVYGRGEDFASAKQNYEEKQNKVSDYNHLKVLVLEDDVLENGKALEELLETLIREDEYPRNTYVCGVEDVEDLTDLKQASRQDPGTYLEEYLRKHKENGKELLTLGDLLDEKQNRVRDLYVPVLKIEDSYVLWEGYYRLTQ